MTAAMKKFIDRTGVLLVPVIYIFKLDAHKGKDAKPYLGHVLVFPTSKSFLAYVDGERDEPEVWKSIQKKHLWGIYQYKGDSIHRNLTTTATHLNPSAYIVLDIVD